MGENKSTESILAICTGLLFIYFIFKIKILILLAFIIGFIGLFINPIANLIHRGWYKFAELLGFVNSKILLSLVFFIFLIPIALISRIFTKNKIMQLHKKEDGQSYYKDREHIYNKSDFDNMW